MLALHHLTIPATRFPAPPPLNEHPRCRLHLPAMKPEHSHYVAATALWDYQLLFMSQRLETSQPITLHPVEGSLPRDFPSGTYYLTGPGQMSDDHGSMVSPLDGHGYLRVFEVDGENGPLGIFRMPPRRILSHYKVDSRGNRLLVMSCNAEDMLLPRSHFTFYEFDPNFNLLQTREFSIDDHLMIHDWAFTDTRYILFGNRVKLDASGSMRAVSGLSPMISALSVNPGKQTTPIYLLPRFVTTDGSWRVPVEAPTQLWLLHAANAFDTQDEENGNLCIRIHATACSYHWLKLHQLFGNVSGG